jgi:hypothetical protein
MTPPARLHPALLGAVIVLCLALIVWMVSYAVPLAAAGQAYLLIVILLAFRYWPPMVRWVVALPVPHRAVFGLLLAGVIVGHYSFTTRTYYPFVAWEIFSTVREDDPVTCRELVATTAGGRKVRLLVEQLFPSIVQFNLPDEAKQPGATERLGRALARAYDAQHPGDPVQRVDLLVMAVPLHPPAGQSRSQPSCELLKHYDVSSGR